MEQEGMHTEGAPDVLSNEKNRSGEGRGEDFHDRLNAAAGEISYRKLGRLTDTHPETVRRYMQGQSPSASFLTNMCRVLGISGEWLLTGRGPMQCKEMRSHALSQADPSELMSAVANTLTDLCDRLDRVERYVQTLETRIRGTGAGSGGAGDGGGAGSGRIDAEHEQPPRSFESKPGPKSQLTRAVPPSDVPGGTSARRIRDAISKRSS